MWARALTAVLWEGTDKAGCAGLGLGCWNNFSRLWGKGAAPSCLVPGRGDQGREMGTRVGQPCVNGMAGPWLFGLRMKGVLAGEPFASPRIG